MLVFSSSLVLAAPGSISNNLTLWLNAGNTSTLFSDSCGGTQSTSDGDRIACWQDQSGNSYEFTASGNIRPTLKTTGTRAINFNPSLQFDGSEDFLEDADGENYINGMSEFSTFVIVDSDVAGADRYIFNSESDPSGAEAPWGLRFDDAGALSGKDDTLKTGIDTGTEVLYEGNESNIVNANPLLVSLHWTSGEAPTLYVDGKNIEIHPSTVSSGTLSNADYTRIGHQAGHSYWQGTIAELILYNARLNATEQQKIESYLSIKYGITLDSGTNYIDTSKNILWDFSSHGSYSSDIAGIFKDVFSGLYQNKSKSSNPDSVVTIAAQENFDDKEALMWGNDNGAASWTSTDAPNSYKILSRIWETQETGEVGSITISIDVEDSDYNIPDLLYGSSYYFIYDSDGDNSLSDENPVLLYDDGTHGDETSSDNIWSINSVDLDTNVLFSFATKVTPYPGGVDDVELWLKANDGVTHTLGTVTGWQDQTGINTITVLGNPQTNQTQVNYNNMIELDGNEDYFYGDTTIGMREVFLVTEAENDAPLLTSNVSTTGSTQQYWLRAISGKAYIGDDDPDYIYADDDIPSRTVIYNHEMVGGSLGTDSRIVFNGENQSVTSISGNDPLESFSNAPRIGKSTDPGFSTEFDGLIGEIIVYNKSLNYTQRAKISTYLAIKYGISLHNSLDYLDSSANTVFASTTTHENYTNNIAGIGRDDGSLLNQTRSKSIHFESIIDISNATDLENSEFLIWGHNNASLSQTGNNSPAGKEIIQRIWRVDQTGDVGGVDIIMNISLMNLSSTDKDDLFLVKNSNTDFSSAQGIKANYSGESLVIFRNINFSGDDFFTLAVKKYPLKISFIDPTLSNDSYHSQNNFFVNVSSNSTGLSHYTFVNFDDSLTLWMRFDDVNSSGHPIDISSRGNNGSLAGDAFINSTGRFGDAVHLDGDGDFINLPASNELIPSSDVSWTMSTWFNAKSIGSSDFSNRIITVRNSPTLSAISFTLGSYDQIQFFYRDDGGSGTTANIRTISTDTWYHYAVSYNGTAFLIYVNGVLNHTITDSMAQTSGDTARIGANPAGSSEYFNGSIDDILLFNGSLSSFEILSLYNASANQYDNGFTNLSDGKHTFIGYTVNINGIKNQTELREITIDTIPPGIGYSTGTLSNNTIISQNFVYVNVSVNETNEANITFRLFNSSFDTINETSFTTPKRNINFTGLSDDVYYYNVTVRDSAGSSDTTELRKIILDTTPPSVTNIYPSGLTFNTSYVVTINATVTDANLDTVLANITFPNRTQENATAMQLELDLVFGNVYTVNFTIPVLAGVYNITIIANDSAANKNDTESTIFLAYLADPNDINTILAWYDGADNTTLYTDSNCLTQVTEDNQEILCWENKAQGSNATVVSGKSGARYRSTPTEKISSSTTLRFNKTNETVYETGVDIRAGTTEDITLFAVYRPRTNDTSDQGQGLWGNDDGSWDRFYYSLFSESAGVGTDGIDDGLISLGGASSGLSIDGAGVVDTVFLLTAVYDGNVSGGTNSGPVDGSQIYFDGNLQTEFTDESHATSAKDQLYLGWDGDNGHYDGDLAEIIVYDRILTLCQIQLVNNYLGAKYGKDFSGIGNSYDYSSPHNNDINGISEYSGNCSVTTEVSTATSSLATIFNPASLDLNDSLTFAHDNAGFSLVSNTPQNYTRRFSQSWKVDVDNEPGNVSVSFDLSTTSIVTGSVTFALLIDSDTDFNDSVIHKKGLSVSGDVVTFTDVNFSNGDYFTLAINEPSPGIEFVLPTLNNQTYHPQNNFIVNISSESTGSEHYAFVDFDNSLLLWMRFDDVNASGHPVDLSGNSINGSLENGAFINYTGKFGDSLYLDGNNDYVDLADMSFDLSNGFTLCAWAYWNSLAASWSRIIDFGEGQADDNILFAKHGTSNDLTFEVYSGGSGGGQVTATNVLSADVWQHLCAVENSSGNVSLYVDAVNVQNGSTSVPAAVTRTNNYIGRSNWGSDEYFNGSIDEILFFNRTLSKGEVSSLYNASKNKYINNFTYLDERTYTFIGYAVSETGKKNQTELRTITIDTLYPQISYSGGTQNNGVFVNQDFVYINVTVNETNEANITFRLFNSSFDTVNETNFTTPKRNISFSGLNDGAYHYNVTVMDLLGNSNTTETRNITLDTINPVVTNIYPSGQTFNISQRILVNATVTDTNLDTVLANITYPNTTVHQLTLNHILGNVYGNNFTIPANAGSYNITIIANDSALNVNDSESKIFIADLSDPSDLSNLRAWYDATDNSTIYTDDSCSTPVSAENQEVRCWQDKSIYGHNATNVSGKGVPEYAINQFNGHSVINFSKSEEDTLRHELASQYKSNFTIFVVIQSRDTSPSLYDSFFSNGEPAHEDHFQIDYTDTGNAFRYGASTKFNFETFSNEIKLYSVTHDGSNVVLYNEGQEANSGSTTEGQVFEHYRINQNRQGTQHHNSRIGEIILYDRVLSACELEMINIYLGDKYGRDFFGVDETYNYGAPHNYDVNGIGQFAGNCSATVDISTAVSSHVTVSSPSSLHLNDSLSIGHDNGGTSISTDTPLNYRRMNQSWRADENDGGNGDGDSVGLVTVTFDIWENSNIGNYDNFVLLIDDDGLFNDATIQSIGSKSSNTVTFTNVNFTNGDYFTLGFNDTTNPTVLGLAPSGNTTFIESEVLISANVTDTVSVDTVLANVTYPNGTFSIITLALSSGITYSANFNIPSLDGLYNITFIANDSAGNINSGEITNFTARNFSTPSIFFNTPPTPALYSSNRNITISLNSSDIDSSHHYAFINQDNSLVLWMRMDEVNASGHPIDISGHGNNGTLSSDAKINSSGKFGDALHLDGDGDFVEIPDDSSLEFGTGNFTYSFWFNAKEARASNQQLFGKRDNGAGDYETQIDSSGEIRTYFGQSGSTVSMDSATNIHSNLNTWFHVAVTRNNGTGYLYLNGILENQTSSPQNVDSTNPLYIGRDSANNDEHFNGSIDEVMIFNRSFTQNEVLALYNATANQYVSNFSLTQGNHSFTGYAVSANGMKNQTSRTIIVDTTPPKIDYSTGTLDNNAIVSQNFVYINVTVNETNEANITFRLFNSSFNTLNETNFTTPKRNINFTGLSDGVYYYNVTSRDLAGNRNTTQTRNITLDTTNPAVTSIVASPTTTFNLEERIDINATVNDSTGIDMVFVNITLPDSSTQQIKMSLLTGYIYNASFALSSLIGTYTVIIIANDTVNNINNSETAAFELQNDIPDPSGVSINSGDDIALSSGTNTTITGSATITDLNGYNDIAGVTGYFFLTTAGVNSADNNSNHYTSACADNGDGDGNTISYNCEFNVSHYAVPTDAGSNNSFTNWTFVVSPIDSQGTGTNDSAVTELNTLAAFIINPSIINFGEIALGANTTSLNQEINVTNFGNVGLDILLSGTNLSCNISSVSVTFLEYEDDPFTYGLGIDLSESNAELDLDSLPGIPVDPTPKKTTYYGLGIPGIAVGGSCNGSIIITGQSDPHND